jgi:hypothetical protein
MPNPYIPPREADLGPFVDNFRDLIVAAPATYGLTSGDATMIAGVVDPWDPAYAAATNPSTRSPMTVAAKNTVKLAMLPIVRTYASQIRLNPGVANDDKIALGLHLPNNSPSPIPAPATMPVVTVVANDPLRTVMKFRDELASPTSRAKAPMSIGMEIWGVRAAESSTDPAEAKFLGMAVKVPFHIDHLAEDSGKVFTVWGRWANRAGSAGNNIALVGPWSAAVSTTIVGTG